MAKKYFARANTSDGCINLIENNLNGMNVCTLSGRSVTVKNAVMMRVAEQFEASGAETEYVMSPFETGMCEAVIFRDCKCAVADGDVYAGGTPCDTDACLKLRYAEIGGERETELKMLREQSLQNLYASFANAKKIHDEWEKIYTENMDCDRLNAYGNGIIAQIFLGSTDGKSKPDVYRRFFGASTDDGSVNYIDNLTEGAERRFFIKGRPGTGKSTFLKRFAKTAEEAGCSAEIYYCSFDKNSLDMVIVPELEVCVFDSTSPHEMYPTRAGDTVLDFYEEGGLRGTDEKFSAELEYVRKRYMLKIAEGRAHLRLAGIYGKEREYYYSRIINPDEISRTADKILRGLQKTLD